MSLYDILNTLLCYPVKNDNEIRSRREIYIESLQTTEFTKQ